jgi:phosphoglycerate dehydrogenase-like enzyme
MRERTPFPDELLRRLPNLKLILSNGIRNYAIDMKTCNELSIPVTGSSRKTKTEVASGGPDSTTQHCVALILALVRHIAQDDAAVKAGGGLWQIGFATGLSGKTFGVVGLGRLGASCAKIMKTAFGMDVIAWSTNLTQEAADEKAREAGLQAEDANGKKTFKAVSREELFSTADVVSIHLVLSDRSRGLINAQDLSLMKSTSFFVNTSRGPLVVEEDLLDTLKAGKIRGAALDVFNLEPLPEDSPWRNPNWGKDGSSQVLITPHMGYVEESSLTSWYQLQVENLERWERGEELLNIIS